MEWQVRMVVWMARLLAIDSLPVVDEEVQHDLLADDAAADVREHGRLVLQSDHRAVHVTGHGQQSARRRKRRHGSV